MSPNTSYVGEGVAAAFAPHFSDFLGASGGQLHDIGCQTFLGPIQQDHLVFLRPLDAVF